MRILLLIAILIGSVNTITFADWTNMNTGINDDLSGVVFTGNNGLLAGKRGLYVTTSGGVGSASWKRFTISSNVTDAQTYNQTKFNHCYSYTNDANNVFACGQDTVNQRAIIMKISFPSLSYSILYVGKPKSSLNKIGYNPDTYTYYAVGDSGLIVRFNTTTANWANQTLKYNLSSISFIGGDFCIGSGSNLIFGSVLGQSSFSFTVSTTNSFNFKDVVMMGINTAYGVGNSYYYAYYINYTTKKFIDSYEKYDFGSLNANCIFRLYSQNFIGTDHGIFKSSPGQDILEWQPSSQKYSINAFWMPSYPNNIYACGKNGVLLYTVNDGSKNVGGLTKPYAYMNLQGRCIGDYVSFSGGSNTSNSCTWYSNNTFVQSGSCSNNLSKQYTTPGVYTIKLISSNGTYKDTNVQNINIVSKPYIKNLITVNKNILCKTEPLIISIDSSEQNVYYTLKKDLYSNFGKSTLGNGSKISFSSSPLKDGKYVIQASSSIAVCTNQYKDSISIDVDLTKSAFHNGTINAEVGETVRFNQNCIDAQNYKWAFSPNANILQSIDSIPFVKFSSPGATQVKLICWSNHGCYDTTLSSGPSIYQKPISPDPCWTNVNNYTNFSDPSPHSSIYLKVVKSKNGILGCGRQSNSEFNSRNGSPFKLTSITGGYLAKYDFDGTLKWIVYTNQSVPYIENVSYFDKVNSVVEDDFGNIYLSVFTSDTIFDNFGKSYKIKTNYPHRNNTANSTCFHSIIKLDSTGKLLWFLNGEFISSDHLTMDKSQNLVAKLDYSYPSSYTPFTQYLRIGLNGIISDSLLINSLSYATYSIVKISPTGSIQWNAEVHDGSVYGNSGTISKIGTDKYNDIYMIGTASSNPTFYSADSTLGHQLIGNGGVYVTKYNSSGAFKWKLRSYGQLTNPNYYFSLSDANVDSLGNIYISGNNNCRSASDYQIIESPDGSSKTKSVGPYYIAKINSQGKSLWLEGCKYSGGALKINIHNDKVSVLGSSVFNNSISSLTSTFTSANGSEIPVTEVSNSDYFVANYDTSGNLQNIFKNGSNKQVLISNSFYGFFTNSDGSFYASSNLSFNNGQNNYINFGNIIQNRNPSNSSGSISKFIPQCGVNIYNSIITKSEESRAINNFEIFPNPSHGNLNINGLENLESAMIEILNSQGNSILKSNDFNKLDITHFPSGIYIVVISNNGELVSRNKLIKI